MGYRGKVKEQEQARALRARNRTLADIAKTLGVSKSSVSLWVRDVPFTPSLRLRGPHRHPHPAHEAKLRQIEELNSEGRRAHREALGRGVSRCRPRALRRGGGEGRWDRPVCEHGSGDDPVLLRVAAPVLRRRCITVACTRLLAPGPRLGGRGGVLVEVDRCTPGTVPTSPPCGARREHSPQQARARLRVRRITAVPRRTGRSWVSCVLYYRRTPFRGSSIGGAAAC